MKWFHPVYRLVRLDILTSVTSQEGLFTGFSHNSYFLNTTFHKLNICVGGNNTSDDHVVPHTDLCWFILAIVPSTQWSKVQTAYFILAVIYYLFYLNTSAAAIQNLNLIKYTLSKRKAETTLFTDWLIPASSWDSNRNLIYRSAFTRSCSFRSRFTRLDLTPLY